MSKENRPNFVHLEVPCRQCDNCLKRRAGVWRYRAKSEFRATPGRTWLITFTLRPSAHFHLVSSARLALSKGGTKYEDLSDTEQWLEVEGEGYREIQLWLKRLRKVTDKFRYLAITEAHKSGVHHWHLLIHEMGRPIRYKQLKGTWPHGFQTYKLVRDAKGAGYVCKYLSKELRARVRASKLYGRNDKE